MMGIDFVENADSQAIADWLAERLIAALAAQGDDGDDIAICLPGGSTPFPILEQLAQMHIAKMHIDWSRIAIWPGDDRIVPADHAASNAGKIRALLEPLGARVINLETAYSLEKSPPHFALVWLGMGADGHIASLFPNTDPQVDDAQTLRRLTPDPLPPEAPFDRVTMSIPALLNSDAMMFVIRGDDKRQMFDGAIAGAHDLPIARLLKTRNANLPVTCFT